MMARSMRLSRLATVSALAWLGGMGLLAAPTTVHAQPETSDEQAAPQKVAVYVEGFMAQAVRRDIVATLPEGFEVVGDFKFKREVLRGGGKLPIGRAIDSEKFRGRTLEAARKGIAKLDASAAILAVIRASPKGGAEVYLVMVTLDSETPVVDGPAPVAGKGADAEPIGAVLAPGYATLLPEEEPEPEPEEKPEEKPEEEAPPEEEPEEEPSDRVENQFGSELFWIGLNFELGGRFFDYSDPITEDTLRDYSVFGAPAASIAAGVYPLAESGVPIAEDLGIVGSFGLTFGLDSETEDGTAISTSWNRFDAGLRFRHAFAERDPFVLGLTGGLSRSAFEFDSDDAEIQAEAPTVAYLALFAALDARIPVGPMAVAPALRYLGPLSAGETKDRFTGPSLGGLAGSLGLYAPLVAGFEARFTAEYQRWFYAFAPEVGDAFVAGGALDQFVILRLGAAYAY